MAGFASTGFETTSLDHEPLDHAVKDQAIVMAPFYVTQKVFYRDGCFIPVEFDFNLAAGGGQFHYRVLSGGDSGSAEKQLTQKLLLTG